MTNDLEKKLHEEIDYIFRKNDWSEERKEKEIRTVICEASKCAAGQPFPATLSEIILNPLVYFSPGGFKEVIFDLSPTRLGKTPKKTEQIFANIRLNAMLLGSFALCAMPHELLHAGVNKLLGGTNEEIVFNKLYGGDIWHALFPEIQAKWLLPIAGAYVKIASTSYVNDTIVTLAPYILTPIGIYFMQKSKEQQKMTYWFIGAGITASHAGGIIGDFFSVGQRTFGEISHALYKHPQEIRKQTDVSTADSLVVGATLIGGFFLGNRIMGYTYRLSKGLVNSIRNYCSSKK